MGERDSNGSRQAPWTRKSGVGAGAGRSFVGTSLSSSIDVCRHTRHRTTSSTNEGLMLALSAPEDMLGLRGEGSFPRSDSAPIPQYVHPAAFPHELGTPQPAANATRCVPWASWNGACAMPPSCDFDFVS